jgi:hypothetical protein
MGMNSTRHYSYVFFIPFIFAQLLLFLFFVFRFFIFILLCYLINIGLFRPQYTSLLKAVNRQGRQVLLASLLSSSTHGVQRGRDTGKRKRKRNIQQCTTLSHRERGRVGGSKGVRKDEMVEGSEGELTERR